MLHFLLFIFFLFLGFLALLAIIVLTKMNQVRKAFKDMNRNRPRNVDGQAITDTRPPEEKNRKIVPDSEGEYVEFEET